MKYKLSNQAIGAIMMALQKSLMEQSDIVSIFQNFQIETAYDDPTQLVVMNAPIVEINEEASEKEDVGTSVQ